MLLYSTHENTAKTKQTDLFEEWIKCVSFCNFSIQYTKCVSLKLTAASYRRDSCVGKPPPTQHYQDQGSQSDAFSVTEEVDSPSCRQESNA